MFNSTQDILSLHCLYFRRVFNKKVGNARIGCDSGFQVEEVQHETFGIFFIISFTIRSSLSAYKFNLWYLLVKNIK